MKSMCKKKSITPLDGAIELGGEVSVSQLMESPLLRQEAKALAEALEQDCRMGLLSPGQTVEDLLRQGVSCPSCVQDEPCIKDGGCVCHVMGHPCSTGSVLGGKRLGEPLCCQACPAGVDLPGILQLLREGSVLEAQRTLMKFLPMAATVCLACGKCTGACVRNREGAPVAVHRVMDWLGKTISSHPEIFFIQPSGDSKKWIALQLPTLANLTAAYYLRRMGNHVVVCQSVPAGEILAPYGERAASLAGPLGEYLENLAYMGVLFEEKSLEDLQQAYSFHQALCLERSPQRDWDSLLAEIPFGVEEARKLNLSYGLKSFLEPGGDFCTFDREGAVLPPALGEGQETCSQQAALREASRCWNCSCFGAAAGSASAALLMLETVIQTSQRRLRAQDYFSQAEPWRQLKPEEALACLEVPMSGDFCSGCLRQGEISLCYAFLFEGGRLQVLRMVFAGVAPVPIRVTAAERCLAQQEKASLQPAAAAHEIMEHIRPSLCCMQGNEGKPLQMEALIQQSLEVALRS